MRTKLVGLTIALLATTLSAQQPNRGAAPPTARPAAPALPPLVYLCPMPADSEIIEDKPGKCRKCGMVLYPARLDSKFWCPTHQTLVVRDEKGQCPLDGKDLVQVTLSESWSCADKPDAKLLSPGACADGKPRTLKYALAAHGDHNPKHGGQFFMASDTWHHIEGTYPSLGLLRMYFYDNFSKPMSPKGFTGSIILLDAMNKDVASYPLTAARDNRTMEARIPVASAALPLNAAAKLKFGPTEKENYFNFPFSKLTIEPVTPTGLTPRTTAAPRPDSPKAAPTTTAGAGTSATRPATAASTATSAAAPGPAPAAQTPLILDSPLAMPPGLAEATDESKLPASTAGLIAELDTRANEVAKLVSAGELAQVWLPAMGTKTVALVLDTHVNTLPERQRVAASAAVKQIVMASWAIDNYGDLGNGQKINEAYQRLATAVKNLKALYAQ